MGTDKIEEVLSENLGEGFRIVGDDGELSPMINWVDWEQQSDDEGDIRVRVHFEDDSEQMFAKGVMLRQVWHEDV